MIDYFLWLIITDEITNKLFASCNYASITKYFIRIQSFVVRRLKAIWQKLDRIFSINFLSLI